VAVRSLLGRFRQGEGTNGIGQGGRRGRRGRTRLQRPQMSG
jgi:hypothetical protein